MNGLDDWFFVLGTVGDKNLLCAPDNLVEAPFVTEPTGRSPPDIIGEMLSELPHGLVRDDDATRRTYILDHAQIERKQSHTA